MTHPAGPTDRLETGLTREELLKWAAAAGVGLSALGTLAATGAGVAYALTRFDARWLWVASAMLVLNWLGDSLDGTLARVRRVQGLPCPCRDLTPQ